MWKLRTVAVCTVVVAAIALALSVWAGQPVLLLVVVVPVVYGARVLTRR